MSKVNLVMSMLSAPVTEMNQEQIAQQLDDWLADDFELHYPGAAPIPYAKVWKGKAGFQSFMGMFNSLVETVEMVNDGLIGVDDTVYISGTTHGRVRASGKMFTSNWILVWTFKGDKVAKMLEYHDTQAIAAAFS